MAEKVTTMVLKVVDLQCSCCYKKIKKILCKFPQIRDQVYDEKGNTVTITVVCCDPERFRDKLCCKGHKVIKSIEIKEPPKPKEHDKKPEKPEKSKEHEKNPEEPEKQKVVVVVQKPKPDPQKVPDPVPNPPVEPEPFIFPGLPPLYPGPTCCGQCYGGYEGGPCYQGYGVPPPPQPHGDYGYGYSCRNLNRCGYCLSDENPSSCSIM